MFVVIIIIILILLIFYMGRKEHLVSKDTRSFYELTDGEKIQYIINTYFLGSEEIKQVQGESKIKKENEYIKSLPVNDTTCIDDYDDCKKWADNGECTINPSFMLYKCGKSCKSCALSPQQKYNVVKIYSTRESPHCVFHNGENYPDPGHYIRQFDQYQNENNII